MKLKSFLPERWYRRYIKPLQKHILQSRGLRVYSQEGEDIIIDRLLGGREKVFYIGSGRNCCSFELKAETIEQIMDSEMVNFLRGLKYKLIAKLFNTVIFKRE